MKLNHDICRLTTRVLQLLQMLTLITATKEGYWVWVSREAFMLLLSV